MAKPALQDLETSFEEELLLKAQSLCEPGVITDPVKLDKHLWVATIYDREREYEPELLIRNNRIAQTTCNCLEHRKHQYCVHTIALALKVRDKLEMRQVKRAPATSLNTAKQEEKFTVKEALRYADPEALAEFVSRYARTDRKFALALRTFFANIVPHRNGIGKYTQLIDAALSQGSPGKKMTKTMGRQLIQTVGAILQQGYDAVKAGVYNEGFEVAGAYFQKLPGVAVALDGETSLETLTQAGFDILRHLVEGVRAPELKEELADLLLKEAFKPLYRKRHWESTLYDLLLQIAPDTGHMEDALKGVDQLLVTGPLSPEAESSVVEFKLRILDAMDKPLESTALILEYLHQPNMLQRAIESALAQNDMARAALLARSGLDNATGDARLWLKDILLEHAALLQDDNSAKTLSRELFLETLNAAYLNKYLSYSDAPDSEVYSELLESLRHQPYSTPRRNAEAALMVAFHDVSGLLDYIRRTNSLDLFQLNCDYLLSKEPEAAAILLDQLVHYFLQHYLGKPSALRMRQLLEHLIDRGFAGNAQHLVELLRKQFKDRLSLQEELDTIRFTGPLSPQPQA